MSAEDLACSSCGLTMAESRLLAMHRLGDMRDMVNDATLALWKEINGDLSAHIGLEDDDDLFQTGKLAGAIALKRSILNLLDARSDQIQIALPDANLGVTT